jgi:diguanylate cyclase (GGDEF)-like protein/PAS domain S-box-containing protein
MRSTPVAAAIVALAYAGGSKLGLRLAFEHASVSAVWVPSGIGLAAVLLGGHRLLPAVAFGALLANITTGAPAGVVLSVTLGGTTAALAGAWLLRRVHLDPSLRRVRDVAALVFLAGIVSTVISATVGVGSLLAFGRLHGSEAGSAWRAWWLGDMSGVVIVGSTLLVLAHTPSSSWLRSRDVLRTLVLSLLFAVATFAALRYDTGFPYLVFPLLFALSLACRQAGAVLGSVIVAAVTVWLTDHGHSPFVGAQSDADLARTQMFMAVGAITALLVAAARTEREMAEHALERLAGSERALADAQSLAQVGSFDWDLRTGATVWSEELYRILGLDPAVAAPGYALMRALLHDDDRASVDDVMRRATQDLTPYTTVHRIIRPDGQLRTLECHGRVECDEDGTPIRMVGTALDVTAIALAEERFRALFENAPFARVVIDPAGTIVLINSHTARLFGYTHEQLVGTNVEMLIPLEPDAPTVWYTVVASDAPADAAPLELRATRRGGEEFPVEVSLTPLVSEEGRLVSVAIADITERKHAVEALAYRASHDPLTGLPNRTLFLDRLEHAIGRARRSRRKLAVMFLDLDDFKLVNDTRGHDVGDLLLVALTPRLSSALRPGDTIARFGGDEFVVLCEDLSDDADALAIAERIEQACSGSVVIGDCEHSVSLSIGVVLVADLETMTPSDVLRDADAAMYRAKATGKGRIELFDDVMRARLVERLAIEASLRRAIALGELRVFFQPIIAVEERKIVSIEALLRWEHPRRGLLEPRCFMHVAESSGLIVPIGDWAIEQACRQAVGWRDQRPSGARIPVSVNVSARELARPDFAGEIGRILAVTGLEPELLALEFTETAVLEDPVVSEPALRALKAIGVRLILDDFGTGFSSLGQLRRMPIDALKIDRSLVGGLGREGEDPALVDAIVRLAGALGVGVSAEGVETHAQLSRLRVLGCSHAQGDLFACPAPVGEVAALLADTRSRSHERDPDRVTA